MLNANVCSNLSDDEMNKDDTFKRCWLKTVIFIIINEGGKISSDTGIKEEPYRNFRSTGFKQIKKNPINF